MALPPLELFSLRKRSPCCRVASSSFPGTTRAGLRISPTHARLGSARSGALQFTEDRGCSRREIGILFCQKAEADFADLLDAGRIGIQADVAQLVEQLIRNQ